MTSPLLFSAAPVFRVEGEVRGELARGLARLEIEETTAGLKTMKARFLAQGPPEHPEESERLLYLDGSVFDFGKAMQVSLGPAGAERIVFDGAISAIEADFRESRAPEVAVFAEDKLMNLRMTRRMRTYENMSDSDIAGAIAQEHGLTPQVDAAGPTYDVVQQWNQSDLAFLRDRAVRIQAEIWVSEDTLFFQSRDRRSAPELTLVNGNQLIAAQLRADLAHQRTTVAIGGYDAATREAVTEEAGEDAVLAEVTEGRTGVAILEEAFGSRVSYRVRDVALGSAEAAAWARAEMLRRARAFVTVEGITSGRSDMVVGSRVNLQGVGRPFEGPPYYVTRVMHTYDNSSGFRTHFSAGRATIQEGA
jgi:uncharacterized protein